LGYTDKEGNIEEEKNSWMRGDILLLLAVIVIIIIIIMIIYLSADLTA